MPLNFIVIFQNVRKYNQYRHTVICTILIHKIIAWHTTETIGEMLGRTGLKVFRPDMEHFDEKSSQQLKECYQNSSDSLIEKLKAGWTDETLSAEDDMYGEKWKRGTTLAVLITHQAHHRGQMTVLMRQAGLIVPGIYGPAKEEWAAYGMEAEK